eukprot:CAMPEP_0116572772 /NCGR_PEP_ID=MMETSP0397-20121206/18369_1 /TAXON_ID=216820 /ORGANISM="Cyclophora tenuis, Strain ECT3854" /LENGTH=141 /DNA_ID=CAMNT_0004101153 /DNA_START=116 /DNA_END=541 /DNA_ORIENTATION=-
MCSLCPCRDPRARFFLESGWKLEILLYLSETLWSIPPHPAAAMFVTNHGSKMDMDNEGEETCVPSSSTYAGKWYSALTLGTNYHCEHHDFPQIPFHRLGQIRHLVPESYYRPGSDDNVMQILRGAFGRPDFYACLDVGVDL